MTTLYLLMTLLLLWIGIAGITLCAARYLHDHAIARASGIVSAVLLLYFIEHYFGLGSLQWAMPPLVLFGLWQLWRVRNVGEHSGYWQSEAVFVAAFLYAFFWRYSFPDIDTGSEKLTDLFFISNYYPGDTLPPEDNWQASQVFDYYYAFQHYAAALLGRVFNLAIGLAYNISFALLAGLALSLAWSFTRHFLQPRLLRLLVVATLALGGTGFSLIFHLVYSVPDNPVAEADNVEPDFFDTATGLAFRNVVESVRFIGGARDQALAETFDDDDLLAKVLLPAGGAAEGREPMVLPAENFGYQFFLGDFHPPLGGFMLLMLALALLGHIRTGQQTRLAQGLLALTVPLVVVTNTWVLPLQVVLIVGGLMLLRLENLRWHWSWLFGGALLGSFLIYPALAGLAGTAVGAPIRLVTADMHTPVSRLLALHWPFLALLLFCGYEPRYRLPALVLSMVWLVLLVLSEMLYVDDITVGQFERTNTLMKWWGWMHAGIIVSCGAICLGSSRRWIRWGTCIVMLCLNVIIVDLARHWWDSGRYNQGRMEGHAWFTTDPARREMFDYLAAAPRGVVLEDLPDNAYMTTSVYAIFNDKPALLGWPSHLMTWHGEVPRVWRLKDEINRFYRGELDNSRAWLDTHRVDYVVWDPAVGDTTPTADYNRVQGLVRDSFTWLEFGSPAGTPIGIWVRHERLTPFSPP